MDKAIVIGEANLFMQIIKIIQIYLIHITQHIYLHITIPLF